MTTTFRPRKPTGANGVSRNGSGHSASETFDLDAPPGARRTTRLPEIALGVLIVAGFALAAVWWQTSATEKQEVLSARHAIARGQVVVSSDLALARINSADPIASIDASSAAVIVGQVAVAEIPVGAVLHRAQFTNASLVPEGRSVVGLALAPGSAPSLTMRVGDVVDLILTPPSGSSQAESAAGETIVAGADVVETAPIGGQGNVFLAVEIDYEQAERVAVAAAQGRVRVAMVAGDGAPGEGDSGSGE